MEPLQPQTLVTAADPDWASFQQKDPDYYLAVASSEITDYCGWHIYPNVQVTATNIPVQSKGIIQLPSLMVTAVASVVMQDPTGVNNTALDPSQYNWFDYGVIEPVGSQWWAGGSGGAYYGPDNWTYLPVYQYGLATVTFNSGYTVCPKRVKEVAFELATTTMEVNAGNVKEVQTPGFRLQPSQPFGSNLNQQQKNRLSKYRLPTVR